MNPYTLYSNGTYHKLNLKDIVRESKSANLHLWSARLSTGIFGLTDCSSGNLGPKNDREILLALGDDGLKKLIELGFLACPSCHPEDKGRIKDFVDNYDDWKSLPFDAARVNWKELLPIIKGTPGRLYLQKGLTDLTKIKQIFEGYGCPDLGYYDRSSSERFTRYF